MPSSSDILAGRAAVELFVDKSAVKAGMDAAAQDVQTSKISGPGIDTSSLDAAVKKIQSESQLDAAVDKMAKSLKDEAAPAAKVVTTETTRTKQSLDQATGSSRNLRNGLDEASRVVKNLDKNVRTIRAGMIVGQGAMGLQDFMQVYELTGDIGRSLGAAMNNAIQLASLINPWAGALTAAAIAGYQIYKAFDQSAASAKRAREEAEEYAKTLAKAAENAAADRGVEKPKRTIADIEKENEESDIASDILRGRMVEVSKELAKYNQTNALGFARTLTPAEKSRKAALEAEQKAISDELNKQTQKRNENRTEIAVRNKLGQTAEREEDTAAYDANVKEKIAQQKAQQKAAEDARQEAAREDERLTREEESKKERNQKEAEQQRERELAAIRQRIETPDEKAKKELDTVAHHEYWNRISPEEASRARESIEKERDKANKLIRAAEEGQTRVRGTFSGSALSGLGGSVDKQLKATESVAKNTGQMVKKLDKIVPVWG